MAKSIKDRVRDSFSESDREDIFKYLDWIRSSLLDYNQAMRKMAAFIVLLIAIFEIVANSHNSIIAIGSFSISKGSLPFILLPGLVAFLFIQMMADAARADQLITIYTEVFRLWSVKAEANDLDVEVLSFPPLYWNPTNAGYRSGNKTRLYRLTDNTGVFFSLMVLIGMLAFEADAYYVLLPTRILEFILWLISLFFTLGCLILGCLIFVSDLGASKPAQPGKTPSQPKPVGSPPP
jgi:hypothetical protein